MTDSRTSVSFFTLQSLRPCQKHLSKLLFLLAILVFTASSARADDLILVLGAPGTSEYGELFRTWCERWLAGAEQGNVRVTLIGQQPVTDTTDHDCLQSEISNAKSITDRPLWIVLIGHGTDDRKAARFNLHGPDLSATELRDWLAPLERPVAVIDCSASSASFLTTLSAPKRVVVTATRTAGEENFARFGEYLSQAIADPSADLDKDDQTSLWEAYLMASARTAEFYEADGLLQTEHALLDDNGDQQGTRADIFRGLQLKDGITATQPLDGQLAHQWHLVPNTRDAQLPQEIRQKRDQLELQILQLRERKKLLAEDEYFDQLEQLMIEFAKLNRSHSQKQN